MNLNYTDATLNELAAIVEIYNSTIASRMVTADTVPVSAESKVAWFNEHIAGKRPLWIVKNEHDEIIGWVSFQSFYGRPAYSATAELSIYLHYSFRGKGLGADILNYCMNAAKDLGIKTLLGFIFQHNQPSLKLFHNAGFNDWGVFPDIAELDKIERTLIIVGKRIRE